MTTQPNQPNVGLTAKEVEASKQAHGENVLTPPKRTPLWKLYIEKYNDPIIKILLVAALVSLGLAVINGEYIETIGIILAIILATTVGFVFEMDAARKFQSLTALGEEQPVKVIREGQTLEVARREVVVGDLIIVETGAEMPADARLIQSTALQIDESSLTGEPMANKHVVDDSHPTDAEATYPSDLILRSTMVMGGRATARVEAVGDATEIGKVARKATELTAVKTPLNLQLTRLAKLISVVGTSISIAAFVIFLTHDILVNPLWHTAYYVGMATVVLKYFMMAVTLIVMAVPEGLPMAVTLALALNMRRMLKSNNLVRKLHACETMGAVTVICTDKTGTLTQNRMQVADLYRVKADAKTEGANAAALTDPLFHAALALNPTADLDPEGHGIGNPTECALLLWLQGQGLHYQDLRSAHAMLKREPFSTERKYMATIAEVQGRRYLFMKGAPEIVARYCDMGEADRAALRERLLGYQNKAMRTLAFACKPLGASVDKVELSPADAHLALQGVAAISDPLRTEVPDAVRQCRKAGIDVKIVTGDTSATAIEIARQIGAWDDATPAEAQITGPEFEALGDDEAYERAHVLRVMSRARPTDKQRLVNLLQKRGEVVAVTGDGTNDAPALNHAHVGLSLGSGTSVAKNASDMTLIDDSFGSIVRAVEWGRSLYKNIQRFIFFQLVVNVTALLLVLGGSIAGTELPLTITQILWVNLIMDTFAAMALASLPPSHEVMDEKPRKQSDFIINPHMAWAICSVGILFFAALLGMLVWFNGQGEVTVGQLTVFFTVFVMLQWWNLFNAKSLGSSHSAFHGFFEDKGLMIVLLIILVGQWIIVTYGGRMFRTEPLTAETWGWIILCTSPVMIIGELMRAVSRLKHRP
mgnify:CR=1 FL=1